MLRSRHARRQPGLPLILLLLQMLQVGFDHIPPVTLGLIASQVVIFLRLVQLPWHSITDVCISPIHVWYRDDWQRLFLASFFHLSDWHLYYNMVSLLWKGRMLEPRVGSKYFLYMIAVFTVLTNVVTVGLGIAADHVMHDSTYLTQCAAGFSGVLFAMKVITTHMSPGMQWVMGIIPVPSALVCWAELFIIQLLVPNASFLGHLAGIIVGLLYIKGPLKPMMDMLVPSGRSYTYTRSTSGNRSYGGGTTGYRNWFQRDRNRRNGPGGSSAHGIHPDTYRYTGGLSEEEQYERALRNSLQETQRHNGQMPPSAPAPTPQPSAPPEPPSYHEATDPNNQYAYPQPGASPPYSKSSQPYTRLYPDLQREHNEEVRQRRLARFQNT